MRTAKKHTPKYFRITQEIAAKIRRGDLPPETTIPSENQLIETYKISNTTARRIHQELELAGLVTRIKGKGTYTHVGRVDRSVHRILGFTKNMIKAGRQPSTRLISARVNRRGRRLVINSRRYSLPGPVCEIQRLRLADGMPMMRETRYISETLCPGIHTKDLERSLYEIYESDYGLQLVRVDQWLSAIVVDGKKTGFSDEEGSVPAIYVEGATFCGKGLILEMEKSIYSGERYHFSVQATR